MTTGPANTAKKAPRAILSSTNKKGESVVGESSKYPTIAIIPAETAPNTNIFNLLALLILIYIVYTSQSI